MLPVARRQFVDQLGVALAVHHEEPFCVGHQEAVLAERVGVAQARRRLLADRRGRRRRRPGPRLGIDDRHRPDVLRPAVARRERRHDLVRAGDRLGVEHGDAAELVAEVDHLARCRRGSSSRGGGNAPGCGRRTPSACRARGRRAASTACCRGRCCWRACGCSCRRRRSGRAWPRGVYQQLTNRRHRDEQKTMLPSGSRSARCRRPGRRSVAAGRVPSMLIS